MSLPSQLDIEAACEAPRSERWLIAYCLARTSGVGDLFSRGITPSHFLGADHHAIADAAWSLFHEQLLGTDESIKAELQDRGHFDRLGGGSERGLDWWRGIREEGIRHVFDEETESDLDYHVEQLRLAYRHRKRARAHVKALDVSLDPLLSLSEREEEAKPHLQTLLTIEAEAQNSAAPANDLADLLEETQGEGVMRIPTGFPSLDRAIGGGGATGRLNYIVARTSHGKSTWLRHIAFNHARRHAMRGEDRQFVYFDLENSRVEAALAFLTICINSSAYSPSSVVPADEVERHFETGDHLSGWKLDRYEDGLTLFRSIGPHLLIDTPEQAGHLYVHGRLQTAQADAEVSGVAFDYAGHAQEGEGDIQSNVELFTVGIHRVARSYENTAFWIAAQAARHVDNRVDGELRQGDIQWTGLQEKFAKTVVGIRHAYQHWLANGQPIGQEPPQDRVDPFILKKKGGTGTCPWFRYHPSAMVLIDQSDQERQWGEPATAQSTGDGAPTREDSAPF